MSFASNLLLFIFSILLIFSALLVIYSKNPINSLFFLISCFILTSIILILFGLEFIGLLYISIYVGAITIFFAFVISMLNLSVFSFLSPKLTYFDEYFLLFFLWVFLNFLIEIFFTKFWRLSQLSINLLHITPDFLVYEDSLKTLAFAFYVEYYAIVILLGIFLFFGLIGVILILTEIIKKT